MKNTMKKILAMVCCLALGVTAFAVMGVPASADGEYFTLTENNRNLFINVDQEIALEDISVVINGVALSGKDVIWTATDSAVGIGGGILHVTKKGIFTLDVMDIDGNMGTVNVITKNADETEYVLYEENFDAVANGTLPEGWSEFKNADVVADEAAQANFPNYIANAQVKDGKLYIGNGANNNYNYVWMPEFLDAFGDYQVIVDMAQTWVNNNMRLGGLVLRGDRTETDKAHPLGGYRQMIRRASTSGDGLRLTSLARIDNAANKTDAKLPFYVGSVRGDWSKPDCTVEHWDPNQQPSPWYKPAEAEGDMWKAHGYWVTYEATTSGSNYTLDVYKSYEQEQFGGDMGPGGGGAWWETYHLKDDPSLEGYELSASTEKWDAVDLRETGAIGFFTSGVQLAIDSVKVVVPASILAANPDKYVKTELDPSLASYQSQKIGVMSDIHLQAGATAADYALKAALKSMKEQGVSAVLFTGDIVNTGVAAEYEKFNAIWDEVMGGTDIKKLTITGNHEFEGVYFRQETYDDVLGAYLTAFGKDEANFHEVVNGIHIIGLNSESHLVDGKYTVETTEWLVEQLDAAKADDPYAPIIVMCHQTLANTTYGSNWGSSATGTLYETLRYYPQVVYLAGHSHFDFTNETSIMQKDFTCIDVPSMQYTSTEVDNIFIKSGVGSAATCYTYQNYLMLEINGETKTMDIKRMKSYEKDASTHAYETVQVKDAWTLNLPLLKKSDFTYTAARGEATAAPTFAAGAKVEVSNVGSASATIKFPAASHADYVHAYNVEVADAAGEVVLAKYFVSDFYMLGDKATEYTLDLEGLPSNTKLTVKITAIESYGKTSEAIAGEFATEAISTPSAGHNVADFLDVNTAVGFVDSSPYRRDHNVFNKAHPIKLVYDETLDRQVAYMGGWVNYPVSQGALKEIADAFTVELTFKSPAALTDVGQCLFGNPESGGITVEYTNAGVFQVGAFIQDAEGKGGYKYVQIPDMKLDTWYHLVYTFDGTKSIAYVNGEKVGEVESVGTVKFNPAVNFLTIGANVNGAGNAAYVFYGSIANARVYTSVLDEAGVKAALAAVENDNYINALYQKWLALYNVKAAATDAADVAAIEKLMGEIDLALNSTALTEEIANKYIAEAFDLLVAMMKYDAKAPYALLEDALDNFTKVHDSSAYAGLQWENNTEIKKTLVSKQNNNDNYHLIYKLPGNVAEIQLDALGISVYDKNYTAEDFKFFVSKDGENWVEVAFEASAPVANAITNYWEESTLTAKVDGEYNYVKIQLNKFGKAIDENGAEVDRVNWTTVMDTVKIWYAEDGVEIPDAPVTPDEPTDPSEPSDPEEPKDDVADVPGESKPQGESTTAVVVALVMMALAAAAAFITAKKRA